MKYEAFLIVVVVFVLFPFYLGQSCSKQWLESHSLTLLA